MADRGRGGGFGSRGGDRGRGRGRGRGRRGGKSEEKEWQPVTKLGRLVKAGKINSMEEIYLHSLPIKEFQIVDNFLPKLKDEVMKLIPAPRGTGLVASPAVKRFLQLAGVEDAYTSSAGSTKTLENTLKATFVAVSNTYGFLTPNLWKETKLIRSPLEEFADTLRDGKRY
ncbi:40S ribosomal protein S2 [Metarhizium anisopliae]